MSSAVSQVVLQLAVALNTPTSEPDAVTTTTPSQASGGALAPFSLNINCPQDAFSQKEFSSILETELPREGRAGSTISVYCHSGTIATIEAARSGRSTFTTLNFSSIQLAARPRAAALAAAETLLLLDEFDEHVEAEVVEPTPVVLEEVPPLLKEEKAVLGVFPEPKMSDELAGVSAIGSADTSGPPRLTPAVFLQAGPVLRSYLRGSEMAGATIELSWLGLGMGAEVLSGGNGIGRMGNTFNSYVGYDFLFEQAQPFRGVLGVRGSLGAATTDGAAAAYLGATAFGGIDFHLGRVWRTRVLAEAGHAGWSSNSSLERLQGFFMGASVLLGASPEI